MSRSAAARRPIAVLRPRAPEPDSDAYPVPAVLSPLAWLGGRTIAAVVDLGRMASLLGLSARSIVRPAEGSPPFLRALARQLWMMLTMGGTLVALVHYGMGSFLSLQAYYGGTFVDGTGAVVCVGLFRNVAPMFGGLILAGLVGVRTTAELRCRRRNGLDDDPIRVPDRDARPDPFAPPRRGAAPGQLAAPRIVAATVAGPILALWGAVVGTVVGWQVAQTVLGVSTHRFFAMFWEMLWLRDVVGLIAKGALFGLAAGLVACHEGLRMSAVGEDDAEGRPDDEPEAVARAAFRAVCLAMVAMLAINSGWFLLFYHAGPAFGPTLMVPKGG